MPEPFDEPLGELSGGGGGFGGGGSLAELLRGGSFAVPGAQSMFSNAFSGAPDDGYSPRRRPQWQGMFEGGPESQWGDIIGGGSAFGPTGSEEGDLWGDLFGGGRPRNPTEAKYWSPYDRILNELIGNAGKAGVFDPNGSPAMLEAIRNETMRDAQARGRGALMRARADASVDPSTYGALALQADLESGRQTAGALGQANLAHRMRVQDWLRQLAMLPLADRLRYHNTLQQHWLSNEVANRGKGTFGDYIGNLIGAGIGGFLPGGGGGVPGTDISPMPQDNYWPGVPDPWGPQ